MALERIDCVVASGIGVAIMRSIFTFIWETKKATFKRNEKKNSYKNMLYT